MERKHRHVVETALTILSQASMSLEYWDHAVTSAVYLINRLPSSSINQEVLIRDCSKDSQIISS